MRVEVARIRVVDAVGLKKSLSSQIMVEEVLGELKIFQSCNDPDLSEGARVGHCHQNHKGLQKVGEHHHLDEVG